MKLKITLLLAVAFNVLSAQDISVKQIINSIEFQQDSVKSVYDWLTNNIAYDVEKLNKLKERRKEKRSSKYDSPEEYRSFLLETVMKTKKGVCEDYSILFDALLKELGYPSFIIKGYTKNAQGRLNRQIGHAWNAVRIKGKWTLHDATWGAGYVEDEKKFVKRYDAQWFNADPTLMLEQHMPYDPMWQLSSQPLSYNAFESNSKQDSKFKNLDFNNLASAFMGMDEQSQIKIQLERSTQNGSGISLINRWRKYLKSKTEYRDLEVKKVDYEQAEKDYVEAVNLFNEYYVSKSKKFTGDEHSIAKSQEKLRTAEHKANNSITIIESMEAKKPSVMSAFNKAVRETKRLLREIKKEQKFMEKL